MNEKLPVSFPGWKSALALSNLTPVVKSSHSTEIITFLHHLKKMHSPATVGSIKQWLDGREKVAHGPAHDALRWFYRNAPNAADEDGKTAERIQLPIRTLASTGSGLTGKATDTPIIVGGENILGLPREGYEGQSANPPSPKPRSYNQRPPWRPMEPRPAAQDLGGPDWERALVATLRVRGLLSRTEDTYRAWAAYRLRHAAFAFGER